MNTHSNKNAEKNKKNFNNTLNSQQTHKSRVKTETKCIERNFPNMNIIPKSSLNSTSYDIKVIKEIKSQLKEIWRDYIMEYTIYKDILPININTNEEGETEQEVSENDFLKENFESKFDHFLVENGIEKIIANFSLKSLSIKGSLILTFVEPWLIHIKFIIKNYLLISLTPKELGELFTTAINHCKHSLFIEELKSLYHAPIVNILFLFYCIYRTEIEKKLFDNNKDDNNWENESMNNNYLPLEFEKIWKENTKEVTECLIEEKYQKILTLSIGNQKNNIVMTPKPKLRLKENEIFNAFQPMRDMYHARIVEDDFQQTGDFAVLELTEKAQKKTGEHFIFTPLKINHDNNINAYTQVKEMIEKYPDYLWQPYKDEFALNIKGNERLSFDNIKK